MNDRDKIDHLLHHGTRAQREALAAVSAAHPQWYRSKTYRERVTLNLLFKADVVTRRLRGDGPRAYEYALSDLAIATWRKAPRGDDPRAAAQVGNTAGTPPAPAQALRAALQEAIAVVEGFRTSFALLPDALGEAAARELDEKLRRWRQAGQKVPG